MIGLRLTTSSELVWCVPSGANCGPFPGRLWELGLEEVVTVTLETPASDWPGIGPRPLPEVMRPWPEAERCTVPQSEPAEEEVAELATPRADTRDKRDETETRLLPSNSEGEERWLKAGSSSWP